MRHYFIAAWKSGQVNTFYYMDFYVMDALLVVNVRICCTSEGRDDRR